MEYWNGCYQNKEDAFTWYCEWKDFQPFFEELVPLFLFNEGEEGKKKIKPKILIPGIGNDGSMVDMYDYGYTELTAYDYAPEGVQCAKLLFGETRNCHLITADARNLPLEWTDSFDAILEKGTLDAIFLSGAKDKDLAAQHLDLAVNEMARVLRTGGVCMSVSAACTESVKQSFARSERSCWKMIRDGGGLIITEDGYTSNNVDASIFAWERL